MVKKASKSKPTATAEKVLLKLDLGAGQNCREGFDGVDMVKLPGIKYVTDLKKRWPWPDESVGEVFSSQFLEHLDGMERYHFADELWRVLALGAKAQIVTPYWSSMRAIQDPSHKWPPIAESSYQYWNEGWRRLNGLTHYPVACNFDFSYGYGLIPEIAMKEESVRLFNAHHYLNTVNDLWCTVVKIAKLPPNNQPTAQPKAR